MCYTLCVARALTEKVATVVDVPTKRALERRAKADQRSIGSVVRVAIRAYLNEKDGTR